MRLGAEREVGRLEGQYVGGMRRRVYIIRLIRDNCHNTQGRERPSLSASTGPAHVCRNGTI
eukprot:5468240-Amphidinium_carterae.1